MATIDNFRMHMANGCYETREYPEAASQSFKAGELVYLASGKVTVVASDGQVVLGLAAKAATGTTDTSLLVEVFKPGARVEGNLTNAGSDVTSAVTHMGKQYNLYRDGTNKISLIDTGDNTAAVFIPVAVAGAPKSTMGDVNARVIAEINPLAMQASMAAD
jgi:hypothetical protein